MYVTSFVLAALAAGLLLAPAAILRLLPVHRLAGQVIRAVNAMVVGGLAAAGLAMSAAVRLAARWAGPGLVADLACAGTAAVFAVAWFILPQLVSRGSANTRNGPRCAPPAAGPPDGG